MVSEVPTSPSEQARPYIWLMGILDRLGFRGEDASEFSEWMGGQLERIRPAGGGGPEAAARHALLVELDQRIDRFFAKRGEPGLLEAVDLWWNRIDGLATITNTIDFQVASRFQNLVSQLERDHSGGKGLRKLEHVLYCTGVLSARIVPQPEEQDPRTAVPAMLEVVWPFSAAERDLRAELDGLIGAEPWRATWELYALRAWAFTYAKSLAFQDDPPAAMRLSTLLERQVRGRVGGELAPANLEQFVKQRTDEYSRCAMPDNPAYGRSPTAFIGSFFAWYCRRTQDLQVRLIGAREYAIAHTRLQEMIEAYRKSGMA